MPSELIQEHLQPLPRLALDQIVQKITLVLKASKIQGLLDLGTLTRVLTRSRPKYSYISNKRRATFILFEEIFQALRNYSRPYVYLFLKTIIENLGENR